LQSRAYRSQFMKDDQIEELRSCVRKLAHDVRSPLTSIGGFARLIVESGSVTGENLEFAQLIESDVERLTEMLNNGFAVVEEKLA